MFVLGSFLFLFLNVGGRPSSIDKMASSTMEEEVYAIGSLFWAKIVSQEGAGAVAGASFFYLDPFGVDFG